MVFAGILIFIGVVLLILGIVYNKVEKYIKEKIEEEKEHRKRKNRFY